MAIERVGLQKTSLVDYPGEVAAAIFTPGCNLRCPYCHNPRLAVPPYPDDLLPIEEVLDLLSRRKGVLGGVCISGGEPLMHPDLPELADSIHRLGLKVKLDTNGTLPERLSRIPADYVALDLKTVPERYGRFAAGCEEEAAQAVRASVELLRSGGIPYEIRTTAVPGILEEKELKAMLPLLAGADRYVLQTFRPGTTLDPAWSEVTPFPPDAMERLRNIAAESGVPCEVL
jgi:pyruvate formate lyase activating enzyme